MKITRRRLVAQALACAAGSRIRKAGADTGRTRLEIAGGLWRVNGIVTYAGSEAEGLLMNVRMVNAVFEDANQRTAPRGFDPVKNTQAFLRAAPEYVAQGIGAFTIGLEGGDPGYEGAVNSAIRPDGTLRSAYLARVSRVIDACDRLGAAVILTCFYQRQDQTLRDERAIRAAVKHTAQWIREQGYGNVTLEIANEFGHKGYEHAILKSASGQAELMAVAKESAPGLLVSSSGLGDGRIPADVAAAADYLTPHLNTTTPSDIPRRMADLRKYGKPVVVNEDDKTGAAGAQAARECVKSRASWGYMNVKLNQHYPFQFRGANDDPEVYATLKHLTTADDYFPPPDSEGGWRTLTDSRAIRRTAGMNVDGLEEALAIARSSTKNGGLLVVRKGWLVYERYFGLGHRDATPNLASCGKSFTSAAVGVLLGQRPERFPDGLDQKVFREEYLPAEAFPVPDARMKEIRLGHLLAMTAGIRGNNPAYVRGRRRTIDPAGPDGAPACVDRVAFGDEGVYQQRRYSTKTLWCAPGEGYCYATSSAHLASVVVRHASGEELEEFVGKHLARPLGWGEWGYGYRNVPGLTHTPGGGGIAARGTDMLRFGYLLANGGRWKDAQLIPRDYVRHCGRRSPYNPHFPYSLQFDVNSDGEEPDVPRDAFWKSGSGGHALYIVPSLELVVWKLGGRDGQYAPADTGLKASPAPHEQVAERNGWQETMDSETARRRTLAMVVKAVEK